MYTYLRKHIRQVPTVSAATCQLFRRRSRCMRRTHTAMNKATAANSVPSVIKVLEQNTGNGSMPSSAMMPFAVGITAMASRNNSR